MKADVSVVIPCFCCSTTIKRSVDSVMSQSLLPKELILVDDASADNGETVKQLYQLQKEFENVVDIRVICLSTNKGPSEARNTGWEAAKYDYIAFLDSDDSWHPEKIHIQYNWMRRHANVALSGHMCDVSFMEETSEIKVVDEPSVVEIHKLGMMLKNPFSTPSVMLKRELPLRFQVGKHYAEDYLMWQRILCAGYKVVRIEHVLAHIHKPLYGSSGLSSHMWAMEKGELSNYWQLWKESALNIFAAGMLTVYSLLKYLRRLFIMYRDSRRA